jgi:DNA topoisomerase II
MAQDFVGSNNVNLLVPSGQFGTRLAGGKDAASPRYIFTQLSPITRVLFPEVDDALLNYREDDGQSIEPEYYCPVIPLIVVNGSQGIGTGWSTYIPPHHPMDVLEYVRAKLDGSCDLPTIHPFARGFVGSFETGDGGYETVGRAYACEAKTVVIDELPLGCWTNKYKEMLLKMRDRGDILGFSENHTTSKVSFRVEVRKSQLQRIESSGLEKYFKLRKSLPTTNMHAFDDQHQIRKFESPQAITDAFFPVRLQLYHDRKSLLESELNHSATVLRNKARFIESVTRGQIDLVSGRKTKLETAADLRNHGFVTASDLRALKNDNALSARRRDLHLAGAILDAPEPAEDLSTEFEYLLSMPISSLAADRIQDLGREADRKDDELRQIRSLTPQDLWQEDLDRLATALDRYLRE